MRGGNMTALERYPELPIPSFFDPQKTSEAWRVPYQDRAAQAGLWGRQHKLTPAAQDKRRIALGAIDIQNTFCLPEFELFVGGRSGMGAVEDNRRFCEFIYRNLGSLTRIVATLDTHFAMQIFHPILLVNEEGEHPEPYTLVTYEDVKTGRWKFNQEAAEMLNFDPDYAQRHLEHYTSELKDRQKFDLTIWPYHAMLGGLGHALASSVEEAIFFHSIARYSQPEFEIKGMNPLTEHYSALGPEVQEDPEGKKIDEKDDKLVWMVQEYDALILAGQAKSHCVAWTVSDLLEGIQARDPSLAKKVYLLEDCTSPVVIPGVIDYTDAADTEYQRFAVAGMNLVKSTTPMRRWPGILSEL
jgi:nicotinamidase-related amidase